MAAPASEPVMYLSECKAPKICETLLDDMDNCAAKNAKACDAFVEHYRQALPEIRCERDPDPTPTKKYTAIAIWLCGTGHERYLDFLSKMKTPAARKLFGSEALRKTLDGHLAEDYRALSEKVGRAEKEKH